MNYTEVLVFRKRTCFLHLPTISGSNIFGVLPRLLFSLLLFGFFGFLGSFRLFLSFDGLSNLPRVLACGITNLLKNIPFSQRLGEKKTGFILVPSCPILLFHGSQGRILADLATSMERRCYHQLLPKKKWWNSCDFLRIQHPSSRPWHTAPSTPPKEALGSAPAVLPCSTRTTQWNDPFLSVLCAPGKSKKMWKETGWWFEPLWKILGK